MLKMFTDNEISRFFDEGLERGHTHLLVVYDSRSRNFQSEYVLEGQSMSSVIESFFNNTNKFLRKIYNLSLDKDTQLNSGVDFNY